MTPLQTAVATFGGQAATARALSEFLKRTVHQSLVSYWVRHDKIPGEMAIALQRISKGKIKKVDLRPDLFA